MFKPTQTLSMAMIAGITLLLAACGTEETPDLTGEWHGLNQTVSELKGFNEWEKTVHITEQQDRRFRGHFEYSEGRRDFFGVIHPGNRHFTWVAPGSRGYNVGHIHNHDKISSCYVEAWKEATAGCAVLERQ